MLKKHKEALKGNYILDTGCGTGNLIKMLENKRVIGVDLNEYALKIAKEKCKAKFIKADLTKQFPFKDESFDGAASCFVVPFINNEKYFYEIKRVLKRCGIFTISIPLPKERIIDFMVDEIKIEISKKFDEKNFKNKLKEILKTSKKNEELIMDKKIDEKSINKIMEKLGFIKLKEEYLYEGYVYFGVYKKTKA